MPDSIDKLLHLDALKHFTLDGIPHVVGNEDCPACVSQCVLGPCQNGSCNGKIHIQEIDPWNELFLEKCDVCGDR